MQAFRQFWHPLRRRIQAIMALYLLIISVLVITNLWATDYLGYLLERSDKSHQQLQALQRLHGDIHQHFSRQIAVLLQDEATPTLSDSTQQIQAHFQSLATISHQEADLVQEGDKAGELAEIDHFQRMQHELQHLLNVATAPPVTSEHDRQAKLQWFSGTVLALYQQNLQPLLDAALDDEQSELHAVKQTQAQLQQRIHSIVTLMVGISVIAALTLVYLLAKLLLHPLHALTRATDALASGRLNTRLPVLPSEEFAQLSQHFNVMAAQLEQQHHTLTHHNSVLEQKVEERTASLQASNERLRQVDHNRRRFLEDVSHELRSPLTILQGEADVTLRDPHADSVSYRTALQTVQAQVGFLHRRINDLMALTRAEDGCLTLAAEPVDLKVLVEQTVHTLLPLARLNSLHLFADTPTQVPLILGDTSWLRQLLLTLVDNAVKFSHPNGTVCLRLQVEADYLQLCVLDSGNGVTASALPYLFERYYQADSAHAGSGFGLGLAIARWIVTQHQGNIQARNRDGKGLCIEARFPLIAERGASDEKSLIG